MAAAIFTYNVFLTRVAPNAGPSATMWAEVRAPDLTVAKRNAETMNPGYKAVSAEKVS